MDHEESLLLDVAARLERETADLVVQQLVVLREFPSYRRVPAEDLERSCRRNVARVVITLRGETRLPPEIIEDERASGRRRALQGIPADQVVAAYRAVLGVLRDAFLRQAAEIDVRHDAVLLGVRRLWDLTDHFSSELVSARHLVDLDLARREERERQTFLHNVLTGTLLPTEVAEAGAAYGLSGVRDLWVLRARPTSSRTTASDLVPFIDRAILTSGVTPLLGLLGGDVVGVAGTCPGTVPERALVAVDGPVPAQEVHACFLRTTTLLDVADRYGMRGLVTIESLSLRVAVAQNNHLGEILHRRYVSRFNPASGMTSHVLESVRAYLDERRSVPAAARALNVHVNTLRYRLERFQAVTGADLQDTMSLFEVWWALQYAKLRVADAEPGAGASAARG